ncbi:hypothetical protein K438DRAFT_1840337 [Mycena galopus ATCC 62051]|nr:hypothetical protein K438DRAFT_1840337 [Mycena galopus ATCC 62051]
MPRRNLNLTSNPPTSGKPTSCSRGRLFNAPSSTTSPGARGRPKRVFVTYSSIIFLRLSRRAQRTSVDGRATAPPRWQSPTAPVPYSPVVHAGPGRSTCPPARCALQDKHALLRLKSGSTSPSGRPCARPTSQCSTAPRTA